MQNPKGSLQPPFDKALKYLTLRARSVKEISEYLFKKGYLENEVNEAIEKLLELKFLNDNDFARTFTQNRQRKGKSKMLISFELRQKGISQENAEAILEDAKDDLKTALEYIEKRLHQFERFDKDTKKKKIITRLRSRGFSWNTISKVLKRL